MWQIIRTASIISIFLGLVACSPIVDTRGHVGTEELAGKIKIDQSSKEDVLNLMGSPSSTSDFGDETWYYISARKESTAFFKPKVVDQHVVSITFDAGDTVKKVDKYGIKDGKKIDTVAKITPTEGHQLGFVEQILGNVGRFSKKAANTGTLKRDRSGI